MVCYLASFEASGAPAIKRFCIVANAAVAVYNLAGVVVFRVPRIFARASPFLTEAAVVAFLCINTVPVFLVDAWYAAKLFGQDPEHVWGTGVNFSDTRPLLALSVLVLGTHMVLPVRWITLLPLALSAVLLHAACALLVGSPDGGRAWSTMMLFASIVACAVLGRRTIEVHQRQALRRLLRERNLRVSTEFQLSQLESRAMGAGPRQPPEHDRASSSSSVRESRPDTSDSARVLEGNDWEQVEQLGRKEQWCIGPEELTVGSEVLGEGGFGSVVAGYFHGTPVAIKTAWAAPRPGTDGELGQTLSAQLNEVRILRRLRHPNITLFHGACIDTDGGTLLLVLERVQGLPLQTAVLQGDLHKEALTSLDRFRAVQDTCRALSYLHSRQPPVVHGDLKASNAFAEMVPGLGGLLRAKLLDFGLSRVLTRHAKPLGGSLMWAAPEVVLRECLPQLSTDVFSFGRLVFFVTTGRFPCARMPRESYKKLFRAGRTPPLVWPASASAAARALRPLAEACSSFEAGGRPTIQEVSRQLDALDVEALAPDGHHPRPPSSRSSAPSPEAPSVSCGRPLDMREDGAREDGTQEERALPTFQATLPTAASALVVDGIGRINFSLPPAGTSCCLYHAALQHLHGLVAELEALGCKGSPFGHVRAQCPFCQTLLQPRFDSIAASLRRDLGAPDGGQETILRCPTCGTTVEACVEEAGVEEAGDEAQKARLTL